MLFSQDVHNTNYVWENSVVPNFTPIYAIPFKSFVLGIKDLLAPSVENANFEVRNLGQYDFGEGETIIQAVAVRCDGIGKVKGEFWEGNGDGDAQYAVASI